MSIKEKIVSSKPVQFVVNSKGFNKALNAVSSAAVAVSALAVSASAETGAASVALSEINSADVINNAMPFVNAALPILCVVGGVKIGVRFLKGSLH